VKKDFNFGTKMVCPISRTIIYLRYRRHQTNTSVQGNGNAWLLSLTIILRLLKRDLKAMKRIIFYVFSDECYVGSQKRELLQRSLSTILD
jgi:hypothetical protein